jgi:hypothetical protein
VDKALVHIDAKREALGLVTYDSQRFAKPKVTWDAMMGYAPAGVIGDVEYASYLGAKDEDRRRS